MAIILFAFLKIATESTLKKKSLLLLTVWEYSLSWQGRYGEEDGHHASTH